MLRLPVNGARIRATRIADRLTSSCFSLISFGTLVALRTWRSNEMARDLPIWERDVGTPQAARKMRYASKRDSNIGDAGGDSAAAVAGPGG